MSKLLPYFRWYPADAETDEHFRLMDDADIGFYIRCLNHAWINGGIPADAGERAKALRTRKDTADKRWIRVAPCFKLASELGVTLPNADTILCNPRQECERKLASHLSEVRAESAKSKSNSSANASTRARSRYVSESVSESSEEPKKKENLDRARETAVVSGLVPSIPAWGRDEQFMEFVVLFRKTGAALIDEDFAAAYQWAWSRLDFEQKAIRLVAIKEKLDADCYPDSQYVPKPQKFIQTEWKRPIAGKQSARKFVLPPPIPPPPEIQALWDADDREKNKNAH